MAGALIMFLFLYIANKNKDMKRIITMTIALISAVVAQAQEQTSILADTLALDGSAVVAQKVLVKMETDKVTYKVEDDIDAKTSTVLDMLRKVPMVSVDAQDNITVNGSSSFQVYVDGMPNQMLSANPSQILKMMPATVVKHIEVITNPGAKYDAEGVGGVINLITGLQKEEGKALTEGQYGSITLQGSTKGYGGGVFYSMQKGKWAFNLTGNASNTYVNGAESLIERTQKLPDGDFVTTTSGIADVQTPFYNGSFNLSYEIDSLNLITVGAGYTGTNLLTDSDFQIEMKSPLLEYAYGGTILSKTMVNGITANVDYQHSWASKPERSLVVSYQFSGSPTDTDIESIFDGDLMPDRMTDRFTNSASHIVQTDFSTPLGSKAGHVLNAGAKFTARHNSSDQDSYMYDFYNNIGALYAEYSGKFGPVDMKVGARYEHTWQNVTYDQTPEMNFNLGYGNLVPNASLQYNISMVQNIGLSYNMRISRPGITYLNPFVDNISDPSAISYGNPDLIPETGHNVSLTYNYFSPKWILNMSLREGFVRNGMSAYSFYDNDHMMNTTYGNIVNSSTTGLNAFVMWIPGQKTRVILNGSTNYTDIRSEELDQKNSGWTYSALLGVQQTLPWDLRLSANAIASGRTVTLQGWSSGMLVGTLGLTKTFLDDRLGVSLSGISHLTGGRGLKVESMSETKEFVSRTVTSIPIRMISMNLTFSFGKQDKVSIKKTRKTIEADTQLDAKSMTESIGTVMQM